MKITFTVYTPDFLNASLVEELLKNNNIKYTTCETEKCDTPPPPAAKSVNGKRIKRPRLTLGQIAEVHRTLAAHPDWTRVQVAQRHGISETSVDRIRLGTHVLLKGAS